MSRDRYVPDEVIKGRRRHLRFSQTKAEQVFWYEIRNNKIGYKFRRQVSIESFIVDFYCHEARLIIELDGPIHDGQKSYDTKRDGILRKKGYTLIRYKNDEVLFDRERVVNEIKLLCSRPHPAPLS